jgi:uncharacterized protein YndB with AHSA1/START domain
MHASPAVAESQGALAPIVIDLVVACPPERAFDYFTRDIGRWWPLATHSLGQAEAVGVRFEPREGGRLVETLRNGGEHVWGEVTRWQPGRQVAFTWHLDRDPATAQWVEVSFASHPGGTRVTLTHGGWERLGENGAQMRENYAGGWKVVFEERYGGYCVGAR